jgi:hypothetical protein
MSMDGLSKNTVIIQDTQLTTKYLTLELIVTLYKLRNMPERQKSNLERHGNQRKMLKANGFCLMKMLNSSYERN